MVVSAANPTIAPYQFAMYIERSDFQNRRHRTPRNVRWWGSLRSPHSTRYAQATGRPIPGDWPFVLAFSFFRLAAIAQGVAKRAEQANASSEQAVQAGRMAGMLAEMGVGVLNS